MCGVWFCFQVFKCFCMFFDMQKLKCFLNSVCLESSLKTKKKKDKNKNGKMVFKKEMKTNKSCFLISVFIFKTRYLNSSIQKTYSNALHIFFLSKSISLKHN